MLFRRLLLALAGFILIPGCGPKQPNTIVRQIPMVVKTTPKPPFYVEPLVPSITIWVHGTRFSKHLLPKFSYVKPGLHHYTLTEQRYYIRTIADTLIEGDPITFPAEHFYLFGWNGELSRREREKAARQLYTELKIVRENFVKKYDQEPLIRIITHSHGGNVALNLAKIKDPNDIQFTVQELILLACPVQVETKHYAHDPAFKKIYSLYSPIDVLQIADPQGIVTQGIPLFSERLFDPADHITQVHVKVYGRSCYHIDFILRRFLRNLTNILHNIDEMDKEGTGKYQKNWHKTQKVLCLDKIKTGK